MLLFGGSARANTEAAYFEGTVRIDPANAIAKVEGRWTSAVTSRRNLSFRSASIGAPDLARRVSAVVLKDAGGEAVPFKAFNAAEYVADADFESFSYSVDLRPLADPRSAAHASWIGNSVGVVFRDDIFPLVPGGGPAGLSVSIVLPEGWAVAAGRTPGPDGRTHLDDATQAVFVVGERLRTAVSPHAKPALSMTVSGTWLFEDREASEMAAEICNEYGRVFGGVPVPKIDVYLIPMPQPGVPKGVWEAETRGSTVVIASSDMPFRTQSVQRLHEQLRHEIFHLWFPNGVDLTGRYDWFYEGAALYESLKTGVAVNRIGFTDMLDTLSRAHGIDSSMMPRRSLIDASRDRLSGNETQLYARGMIVAFLTDLLLLQRSRGRRSIETMLAELYRSYKGAAVAADGNAAVLALYDASPELRTLAADHIRGAKPIDWSGIIEAAGLEHGPGIPLRVRARISGRQKALLDKLGYNNWRKLTRK